ncbi:putative nuclease HARBI1 [Photinus pyralis]|uniref:putative nuclease HARBI1 n=1 Tax=Photinus pyralis TaxID=7054 RepID=UPI00126702A0|nr:putative nuclease HARBI1 [Photinus pyralis]
MELLLYTVIKNRWVFKDTHPKLNESDSDEGDDDDDVLLSLLRTDDHPKVRHYVKCVVLKYNPTDFRAHFRISRQSVEEVMQCLGTKDYSSVGRPALPLLDSVLLMIWTISNQESFRSIADRFGIGKGHAHRIFLLMCQKVHKKSHLYIKWPKGAKAQETVTEFSTLRGENSFPNVFGCVDGTHIPIPGPLADNSYYNRKGFHSVLLQGICNAKQEFINVYCGWPGSVHDSKMWQNSKVYKKLEEGANAMLLPGCYLLGDTAYPIKPYMMVPFKDNGTLTLRQRRFNAKLSSTRVVIEQAYGRLKSQFRRLKYLPMLRIQQIPYVITTACILHNIGVKDDPEYCGNIDEEEGDNNIEHYDQEIEESGLDLCGVRLRNQILSQMKF